MPTSKLLSRKIDQISSKFGFQTTDTKKWLSKMTNF